MGTPVAQQERGARLWARRAAWALRPTRSGSRTTSSACNRRVSKARRSRRLGLHAMNACLRASRPSRGSAKNSRPVSPAACPDSGRQNPAKRTTGQSRSRQFKCSGYQASRRMMLLAGRHAVHWPDRPGTLVQDRGCAGTEPGAAPGESRREGKQDAHRAVLRPYPHLTYQILTKRPENMAGRLPADWGDGWTNVWLGVSVEGTVYMDRLDILAGTPAAVRFVSYEPALTPVNFTPWLTVRAIDWLIVGGENGKDARPFDLAWASEVLEQCSRAGVAVFVKQLGDNATMDGVRYRAGRKGKDQALWPVELRVRQWPHIEAGR